MTALSEQEYYTKARVHVRQIWESLIALEGMGKTWNALDFGTTLDDGTDINLGLTKTEMGAAVITTTAALRAVFDSGHATNFAQLL